MADRAMMITSVREAAELASNPTAYINENDYHSSCARYTTDNGRLGFD